MFDYEEIKKTINGLKPNGELFEVRIINKRLKNLSGYFTNADKLIRQLNMIPINQITGANIYFTLNRINSICYAKEQHDKFLIGSTATTDGDITDYEYILIDFDPKRPSGISSSDKELDRCLDLRDTVYRFLEKEGFKEPTITLSGNGCHLLYKVDFPNTEENKQIVKHFIEYLGLRFSDSYVDIDTTVFNPARVCKLYGTLAQKGANMPDRPHRMSKTEYISSEVTPLDNLKKIANMIPKMEQPMTISNNGSFDLKDFLNKHNIRVKNTLNDKNGIKYILEECPFNPEHNKDNPAIFLLNNGAIGFKCFHNSCSNNGWKEFRRYYEPDYEKQSQPQQTINKVQQQEIQMPKISRARDDDFMSLDSVVIEKKFEVEYTNIKTLDGLLNGIAYGKVSLWTGITNHGKTTLMTQFAKECIKNGKKIFYFAGEQTASEFKNFFYKSFCKKEDLDRIVNKRNSMIVNYVPKQDVIDRLDYVYGKNLFLYNNKIPDTNVDKMLDVMSRALQRGVRIFFIDNFMQLDGSERIDVQTAITEKFNKFASTNNVIVNLVAHPRKTQYLQHRLTIFDISGSQNIANKSANICTIMRVDLLTDEEKRDIGRALEKQKIFYSNPNLHYDINECDGIVEILKTKGNSCKMVGLKWNRETNTYQEAPMTDMVINSSTSSLGIKTKGIKKNKEYY